MWANTAADIETNFMSGGVVNTVEIDRSSTTDNRITAFITDRHHTIDFHCYYGAQVSSSTRVTFRVLIEAIREKFKNNYLLDDNASLAGPFNVARDTYIMKGGVFMHYAQCDMIVRVDTT